ncbi:MULTISPECIES: bifunctional [glutamine synthetase] adenylyltransferase/[glutamine synthetase]-adenylyl-L-tyrosine phosphorylase [Asticcacaulis]|uniref:bifunctional [glutamine synthetase] adenylyltransferase/[glutamine synthetase]-adenylyl-L-tyrosine phosphorylase n=1 Tax=Asticcacaulis TaxID=76890 RepID=UPI001AE90285|nr:MULTISPECIES: bifunctional [glutamine synthetase] adenylyltransferase/[glutamine synthetase]-adenylyl-L-tyrosine phosphorylase [Asticcacaulis]MBP2157768.1 glutamate-ammonia-ligase adenylyltransferase [Asticcacaulis solisilvae]MDR6798813.1 glutamate-ammonia-ligase adenylyltransferase [Asticcacaulis sp. BE141]
MNDVLFSSLVERLHSCGPVLNAGAADYTLETLHEVAKAEGWRDVLLQAEAAIRPIVAASPYLAGLMRRDPQRLRETLITAPEARLKAILLATEALEAQAATIEAPDVNAAKKILRHLKADTHLLTAMADLGDVWSLDHVTAALTRFADAVTCAALALVVREERDKGRLLPPDDPKWDKDRGVLPGLFVLAMGKHGAGELNYSSDIDITFFCDLDRLPLKDTVDPQTFADRVARQVAVILSERTGDGYVFRVDLRLRPDPSSTPTVVSVPFALNYYESVGQNWERASFIKARHVSGDPVEAKAFMTDLTPFIWRRSLDYPAIADVHSIKRQIHVYKVDERLEAAGANLKLGAGGIREIEFFAQTQQLILGGRDPSLRSRRTLDALDALRRAGHLAPAVAKELKQAYVRLRNWEHRVQMIHDEQTHELPEAEDGRMQVAVLSGFSNLSRFDLAVSRTLRLVNGHYGELFSEAEPLSSSFGSLVFTGVEDDPETIKTLQRMGFEHPDQVAATIRSWHHGRIPATRSERGRELFTRLVPRLLEALNETGTPSIAFTRFAKFFVTLSAGVQIQSLFLANPKLFSMVVEIMGFSPRLSGMLARHPTAFDAMLDAGFFEPLGEELDALIGREVERVPADIEAVMNALRRVGREQQFRIGMQILSGRLSTEAAGAAYARVADACVSHLAPLAVEDVTRQAGRLDGQIAIIALGKLGSQEMTATSDLDLMAVYLPDDPSAGSTVKGWAAETWFARVTQRLIAALSAPTHEGTLYEIDMKLRPTGAKGPVAVSLAAFENYYTREADTWEFLALTRARVVWASSADFADLVRLKVETILRTPRSRGETALDVLNMRALMEKERPAKTFWDFKLSVGGQVDAEFAAQFLQLVHASEGGPLRSGTLQALTAMQRAGLAPAAEIDALILAWRVQQSLAQVMRVSLTENDDPHNEPEAFQRKLARAVHTRRLDTLEKKLKDIRKRARQAFERVVSPEG